MYGSPVPGYAAPEATIGPAGRVGVVLCRIVADGVAAGVVDDTSDGSGLDATILPGLAAELGLPSDPTGSVAARAVHAWTSLFGLINFELFGHTHNVVVEDEKFFTASTARLAAELGVPVTQAGSTARPSTSETCAAVIAPSRRMRGSSAVRSTIVDATGSPDGPPSR